MIDKKDVDWEHLKKKIQQVVDKKDSISNIKHIDPGDWEQTKKRIEKVLYWSKSTKQ